MRRLCEGTSEAFLHAVANESQLKRSNDSLLLFSLIYVILNVLLVRSAGVIGLIIANSTNMALRIAYSAEFIKEYFKDYPSFSLHSCLPSGWMVLLFSGVVTFVSEKLFLCPDIDTEVPVETFTGCQYETEAPRDEVFAELWPCGCLKRTLKVKRAIYLIDPIAGRLLVEDVLMAVEEYWWLCTEEIVPATESPS